MLVGELFNLLNITSDYTYVFLIVMLYFVVTGFVFLSISKPHIMVIVNYAEYLDQSVFRENPYDSVCGGE